MKQIFDIFSRRKTKEKKKAKIIADIHEKNSLIISELKSNKKISLEIKSLKIADYIIGNVAIERKSINDFISSLLNKRLMEQVKQLKKYKNRLLIIEGDINEKFQDTKINQNAIFGFVLSLSLKQKIPVIQTKDYKETSAYLITLANQQIKNKNKITLHSLKPKTLEEQKKYILESFPGIGAKISESLLENFSTLKQIFSANEEELKKISNFREKRIKQFKNLIDN